MELPQYKDSVDDQWDGQPLWRSLYDEFIWINSRTIKTIPRSLIDSLTTKNPELHLELAEYGEKLSEQFGRGLLLIVSYRGDSCSSRLLVSKVERADR